MCEAYAARTGTRRNLAALRARGWRLMVSAYGDHRAEGFPYALDNGAWSAHQAGQPWQPERFERLIAQLGPGADFVIAPDLVAGGRDSLRLTEAWLPRLEGIGRRRLIAVQDGMEPPDVAPLLGDSVGIFVGGSTAWKLATMASWGELARQRGAWCHVGRVNTTRRVLMCIRAGAHSFDGSSASRFALSLPALDHARRQLALSWVAEKR